MRIVIDLQGAQSTGSRNRGIGRYSTSLALGMCRYRGDHEILLALNGAFPDSIDEIRQQFADILPPSAIRVFHPLPNVNSLNDSREAQREASAMAWEAFLASLDPDVVHVSSLFEGLSDDAVTSIGAYGFGRHLTAVTLYDLIPLINQERYLSNSVIDRWYRRKVENILRADLLLSISESSRREGLEYLHFSESQIVNISTAADPQFQHVALSQSDKVALRERHGINRPFIMYTGGIDYRKNIEGLIEAYALLPARFRKKYALAVVCTCHEADRNRLLQLARDTGLRDNDLVLTGFVPEDDLISLYSSCRLFVFPSWHEGFGLPALEAMWCGAPVIGSNRSSLPEVIGWDEATFDPFDSQSIADKLKATLRDTTFTKALVDHGRSQCRKFSWEWTARRALRAIEQLWSETPARAMVALSPRKPRLAYVSPIPPARSGIAEYSAELIPELAQFYQLDLIVPDGFDISKMEQQLRNKVNAIREVSQFVADHDHYDRVLYHFGNSEHHMHMFDLLTYIPGVVVLHDFYLSGILSYWEHHLKAEHIWSHALYNTHGYQGLAAMMRPGGIDEAVWTYPSNRQVIEDADGIIVHSENSLRLARKWIGESCANQFALIPHLRVPEAALSSEEARKRLGFTPNDLVICSFGLMAATKHNRAILDAWLKSNASSKTTVHLVFVGQRADGAYGAAIDKVIARSGKASRIRVTGWTDSTDFKDYLRAADIAIQLRTLSRGETSGTVLDCMNFGLPTIINANGAMADIPDDCVVKLDDEFTQADLVAAIDRLVASPEVRKTLGQRGRKLIESAHDPAHCASLYKDAIERLSWKAQLNPMHLAARIRSKFDADLSDMDLRLLAERLDWNAAGPNTDGRILINVPCPKRLRGQETWRCDQLMRALKDLVDSVDGPGIEPIYWCEDLQVFRYARRLMLSLLGLPLDLLADDVVPFRIGDVLLDLREDDRSAQHDQGLAEVRRRVTLLYCSLSSSVPARGTQPAELTKEVRTVSEQLKVAGWHPM